MPNHSKLPYRQCVAIALFNDDGKVFAAERNDIKEAWQMPQGGVDDNETIEQAAMRELKEEIGTNNIEIIEISKTTICYDWPSNMKTNYYQNKFRGQEQHWIAARFKGKDNEINLNLHEQIEFNNWKWVNLNEMPELIVPFKRDVYIKVANMFSKYSIEKSAESSITN